MLKRRDDDPLRENLEEIRRRLLRGPATDELVAMQLEMSLLEKWDGLMMLAVAAHDHDHMDDHDHEPKATSFLTDQIARPL